MATVLVITLGGAMTSASTASASSYDPGGVCPRSPKPVYVVSWTDVAVPFANIPVFKDGKGGTMQMSRSYTGTASAQVTVGAEVEVGPVFLKAKASVSGTLMKSNTTATDHGFNRHIRSGWYGHMRYVSWGKQVRYVKYDRPYICGAKMVLARGTINFPGLAEGWMFWETRS
jgi:hypothetical protein